MASDVAYIQLYDPRQDPEHDSLHCGYFHVRKVYKDKTYWIVALCDDDEPEIADKLARLFAEKFSVLGVRLFQPNL